MTSFCSISGSSEDLDVAEVQDEVAAPGEGVWWSIGRRAEGLDGVEEELAEGLAGGEGEELMARPEPSADPGSLARG